MSEPETDQLSAWLDMIQQLKDIPTHVSGSLLRPVISEIANALLILSKSFLHPLTEKRNPGLKFENTIDYRPNMAENLFSPLELRTLSYDPVDKKYYQYLSDPLGNPLQVELNLDRDLAITKKDGKVISQYLESVAITVTQISQGRFDWRAIKAQCRTFRKFLGISSAKKEQQRHNSRKNSFFYHQRHRPRDPSAKLLKK